jgi:mannose-6-phosphate isomerase
MTDVHPLKFEPLFQRRIWGGRGLATHLGKKLPPDEPIGESWEIADLENGQSVVAEGAAKGKTLGGLVRDWGADLLGRAPLFEGRFPLLIKYLDAQQNLSIQVHPTEAYAQRAGGAVRTKNEAWYILHAAPDGCIYRGVKPGVNREQFAAALARGEVEPLLQRIRVKAGQAYYLPSGTVHALGGGVMVAEVQTPSDTTFRVFDWNRIDAKTGQPRELHVEEALECIDFSGAEIKGEERSHVGSVWTTVTRLCTCDSFVVEQVRMVEGYEQDIPYAEPVVWMVLEGQGTVSWGGGRQEIGFTRGDTLLLPAALKDARLRTEEACVWLEVTLPTTGASAGTGRQAAQ